MRARNIKFRMGQLASIATLGSLLSVQVVAAESTEAAAAESTGSSTSSELADAFKNGSFNVNFRYRYEFVDWAGFDKDANASTLRTRLVYKSGNYKNTFLTIGMDDLRPVVSSNFNDTRNGKSQYPVVADPKGTDLNLASLTFTGLEDASIVLGRQRIIRENSRFVGNVGWRQNEQTFDSASIDYAITDKFQVFYSYVDRVKRIFGPNEPNSTALPAVQAATTPSWNSSSHLVDAAYTFSPALRVVGYGYWLDLKNAPNFSSQTTGLRLTGGVGDEMKFSYTAEYAQQREYKDNPNSYSENYYHLVAGLDWTHFGFKGGYEVLGGSGVLGESFQTPLATLHKFNGLADLFLVTPGGGIQDAYVQATAKGLGGSYSLVYHDFSQETGSNSYGTELDLIAKWKVLEHYSILAGFGLFESKDGYAADVDKVWLMLTADF
jgi:hypothetical protein